MYVLLVTLVNNGLFFSNCHLISINYINKKFLVQGCFAQIHERLRSPDIKIHLKFLFVVSLLLLI